MSSNDYDKLTDTELHTKLKAIGYDLPISINRDFLVRKLQQAEGVRGKTGGNNNATSGTGSPKQKRLSLNVQPTPVSVPNKRLARNSIAVNHQPPPPPPVAQVQPAAPLTPPRNRKPTPPRQIAKPTLPPPQPSPPLVQARKTTPQPQTQRIPFANRYRNVEENDENSESDEEAEEEVPVPLPTSFGNRMSTSIRVREPPKPPSPVVGSDRVVKYMKLFNNHEESNDRGSYRRAGAGGRTVSSGRFSSDDDSGDDGIPSKPRAASQSYRSIWNKFNIFISDKMPGIPNLIKTLFVTFFMLIIVIYAFNKFQNSYEVEPVTVVTDSQGKRTDSFLPICGRDGVDPSACIPEDSIFHTKQLFQELRTELDERRRLVDCKSPEDERAMDNLSIEQTKSLLYRLSSLNKPIIDATFQYLVYFIIENPKLGLIAESQLPNGTRTQLSRIDQLEDADLKLYLTTTSTDRALFCAAFKVIWNAVWVLGLIAVVAFLTYGGYQIYTSAQHQTAEKKKKLFSMVEDILNLLQEHHENSQLTNDEPLAIHHIRDNLIQPSERTAEKLQVWNDAIQYILNHESRVREEMHHIKGEEYRVLKWLPTISPKRANLSAGGWQGQAFEIIDGSPNSLPLKIPTNCLKVRHMYDTKSLLTDELKSDIEAAVNSKAGIKLKHIGYDNQNDCCVYIKCFNKDDAKTVYLNLHGNWYNGKLLSAKFLREERYDTRFPEAALGSK